MGKRCQWDGGCRFEAIPKERFCPLHRKAMLRRMEADGYLQPLLPEAQESHPADPQDLRRYGLD